MIGPAEFHAALDALGPLFRQREYLRQQNFADEQLSWIFPEGFLPGCTELLGMEVIRAQVPEPRLGVRALPPIVLEAL